MNPPDNVQYDRNNSAKLPAWQQTGKVIRVFLTLLSIISLLCGRTAGAIDYPKADEHVLFFPALAWQSDGQSDGQSGGQSDGQAGEPSGWTVELHGWIFEPNLFSDLLEPLRLVLGLPEPVVDTTVDADSQQLWEQRGHWFTVDNERGKRLAVRLGNDVYTLPASRPNGHFSGVIELSAEPPAQFAVETAAHDSRRFTGELLAIPPTGLSIVSDIDDTIKISQVLDTSELLRNTFLRPYRAVPGMADLYQHWQARGAVFHYVSASPWQLYRPLRDFMDEAGYPLGSFQMRYFRWKDQTAVIFLQDSSAHKTAALETLLSRYPQRQFLLIGDAGEHDPEIYGALARRFPEQVKAILIRALAGADLSTIRWKQAFAGLPASLWHLFSDPAELPDNLLND